MSKDQVKINFEISRFFSQSYARAIKVRVRLNQSKYKKYYRIRQNMSSFFPLHMLLKSHRSKYIFPATAVQKSVGLGSCFFGEPNQEPFRTFESFPATFLSVKTNRARAATTRPDTSWRVGRTSWRPRPPLPRPEEVRFELRRNWMWRRTWTLQLWF